MFLSKYLKKESKLVLKPYNLKKTIKRLEEAEENYEDAKMEK